MKRCWVALLGFLFIVVSMVSCANSANETSMARPQSPLKAWIGMSVDELKAIYPEITAADASNDRYVRPATEFGLEGNWMYSFTNRKLHWFVFNSSQIVINKLNFNACLSATTDIIDNYQTILGKPQRLRIGIDSFNDPEIKPHNGYLVEQASWESPIGRVRVDFSFLGENKAYEFLVSMQVSN